MSLTISNSPKPFFLRLQAAGSPLKRIVRRALSPHTPAARPAFRATLLRALCPALAAVALLLNVSVFLTTAHAQNIQSTEGNTNSYVNVESEVDPNSLGLNVRLQLAENPGRKGMNMPVFMQYSSKVWKIQYSGAYDRAPEMGVISTITEGIYTHGWSTNLKPPTLTVDDAKYDNGGNGIDISWRDPPESWFIVPRLQIKMSDGSAHEFRKGDWMYEVFLGQTQV